MATVMDIDDPRWARFSASARPADTLEVEGFHAVEIIPPSGFVGMQEGLPILVHEMIAWLADDEYAGVCVFEQDYYPNPRWMIAATRPLTKRLKSLVAYFDDPDTAFAFKMRWA